MTSNGDMRTANRLLVVAIISCGCACSGLIAWVGYGRNVSAAIKMVTLGTRAEATRSRRMPSVLVSPR
jgi:hypothetical protein